MRKTNRSRAHTSPICEVVFDWCGIKLVLRDDHVIEIYSLDAGLEEYAGTLKEASGNDRDRLIEKLRGHIKKIAFSMEAYEWLNGLYHSGLLQIYEDRD